MLKIYLLHSHVKISSQCLHDILQSESSHMCGYTSHDVRWYQVFSVKLQMFEGSRTAPEAKLCELRKTSMKSVNLDSDIRNFPVFTNFSVLRRKISFRMYKRVLVSSNSLVRTLLDSNFLWHLGFLNSGCKYFLAIMCVRLHFSRVTTRLCFNCICVYVYIYSVFYGLLAANKSFQAINQSIKKLHFCVLLPLWQRRLCFW